MNRVESSTLPPGPPAWESFEYPFTRLCAACPLPTPALLSGPRFVTLLVTWRCNSTCRTCGIGRRGASGRGELSTPEILELIADLDAHGTTDIIVSGGEPLLRDDIFEILSEVSRRNIAATCALCTNATLIDATVARKLSRCGIQVRAVVSLDGPDAATHDAIRGAGTFDRTTRGVRNLIGAFGDGVHVGINTIVNRANADKLFAIVRLVHDLGARTIKFAIMFPEENNRSLSLTRDQFVEVLEASPRLGSFARSLGLDVIDLVPFAGVSMSACFTPWLWMVVDPEGRASPCMPAMGGFNVGVPPYCVGNLRDEGVDAVWNGPRFAEFREKALTRSLPICGRSHCGDVTNAAANFLRGPCRSCLSGAPFAHPFSAVSGSGMRDSDAYGSSLFTSAPADDEIHKTEL